MRYMAAPQRSHVMASSAGETGGVFSAETTRVTTRGAGAFA
jgi:hypothetical protein